jgi:hypothetical protein
MIRANCRARFTAADLAFIVRTVARSQTDQVSLVDLLSDVETCDSILDHPRLVDAILNKLRTSADIVSILFLCSGPPRLAAGRNRRPRLRIARRYPLTHATFRRCRPGNMVWRIVPVNIIR